MKKIFIAGHKGMVGSAILRNISKKNKIVIADRKKLNLLNFEKTYSFFKRHKFNHVYICAAKVGGILANSKFPADFIFENLQVQNNCIISAFKTKVEKLLFLGSSCIYPKEAKIPIKEEFLLTGKLERTNDAYALAKIAGIKMCESFNKQYGTDFRAIMPTNLYGPNDNYNLTTSHVLASLIKKILTAKKNNKKIVTIWGNGKPKREFLHVDDFAEACIKIMSISKKKYLKITGKDNQFINVGSGKEISVKDLALLISDIVNYKGRFKYDKTKPNGTMRKLIDSSKIKQLNWHPKTTIRLGIETVIEKLNLHE
jgi:GDP-L-fucose synthase